MDLTSAHSACFLQLCVWCVQGMDLTRVHCGCDSPMCLPPSDPPEFRWTDFNRIGDGECLSFQARNTGKWSVALGNGGKRPFVFRVSDSDVTLVHGTENVASSDSPYGVAFTDSALSARYFVCQSQVGDELRLEYGRDKKIVLTHRYVVVVRRRKASDFCPRDALHSRR